MFYLVILYGLLRLSNTLSFLYKCPWDLNISQIIQNNTDVNLTFYFACSNPFGLIFSNQNLEITKNIDMISMDSILSLKIQNNIEIQGKLRIHGMILEGFWTGIELINIKEGGVLEFLDCEFENGNGLWIKGKKESTLIIMNCKLIGKKIDRFFVLEGGKTNISGLDIINCEIRGIFIEIKNTVFYIENLNLKNSSVFASFINVIQKSQVYIDNFSASECVIEDKELFLFDETNITFLNCMFLMLKIQNTKLIVVLNSILYIKNSNFQGITSMSQLIIVKNCFYFSLFLIQISKISLQSFIVILDTIKTIINSSIFSEITHNALTFTNSNEKILINVTFNECISQLSTPTLLIFYTKPPDFWPNITLNYCVFSSNKIFYNSDKFITAGIYIKSFFQETISIEKCNFKYNMVVPTIFIYQLGDPCGFIEAYGLIIKNSVFSENSGIFGSTCFQFQGYYLNITKSVFFKNKNIVSLIDKYIIGSTGSGSLNIFTQTLYVKDCKFVYNMNYFGGNLYLNTLNEMVNMIVEISYCVFIDNYSHTFGGAIYWGAKNRILYAYVIKCFFYRNWANYNGGGINVAYSSETAYLKIYESYFFNNYADFGPAIFLESSFSYVNISNCLFWGNRADFFPRDPIFSFVIPINGAAGGAIGINGKYGKNKVIITSERNLYFNNSAYKRGGVLCSVGGEFFDYQSIYWFNKAEGITDIFQHYQALSKVEGCRFLAGFSERYAISLTDDSYLFFQNSSFEDYILPNKGIFKIESLTQAFIKNCTFKNIISKRSAVASLRFNIENKAEFINNIFENIEFSHELFNIEQCSNVIISNNTFNYIVRIVIIFQSFLNFKFNMAKQIYCSAQTGCVLSMDQISNCNFQENYISEIKSESSSSLFIIKNSKINCYLNVFTNFEAKNTEMGAIFTSYSNMTIKNCSFFKGLMGGFLFENTNISMIDSYCKEFKESKFTFYDNYFSIISFSMFELFTKSLDAGVLKFYNSKIIISNSSFLNNSAIYNGGVSYLVNSTIIFSFCVFKNNEAQKGGVFYSILLSNLLIENSIFQENKAYIEGGVLKFNDFPAEISKNNTFLSNKALYGPIMASFPIRIALKEINNSNLEDGEIELKIRPSQTSIFLDLILEIRDYIGQIVTVGFDTDVIKLYYSGEGIITGENTFSIIKGISIINRIFLSINSANTTDMKVIFNCSSISKQLIYNLKIQNCKIGEKFDSKFGLCITCENGRYSILHYTNFCNICPPQANYCYSNIISLKPGFWRSSNQSDIIYECNPYSESCIGSKESECGIGYRGVLCQSCEINYGKYLGMTCVKCADSLTVIAFRLVAGSVLLMMFYILIIYTNLGLVSQLQIDPVTKEISDDCTESFYSSMYNKILINYVQITALLKSLDIKWPEALSDIFQVQYVLGNAPMFLYTFDCLLYTTPFSPIYIKTVLVAASPFFGLIIVLIFWKLYQVKTKQEFPYQKQTTILVFVSLVQPAVITVIFDLLSCRKIDGKRYLTAEIFEECDTSIYNLITLGAVIPSIIIWVGMYPLVCLHLMLKNRRKLKELSVRKQIGFLYNSYKTKFYYWDIIEMYKKFLLISMVSFSGLDPSSKYLFVLMILSFATFAQAKFKPYLTRDVNFIAFIGNLVCLATIFWGLVIFAVKEGPLYYLSIWLVFVNNIGFLLIFLQRMVIIYKKKLKVIAGKIPFLKKKIDILLEKFTYRGSGLLKRDKLGNTGMGTSRNLSKFHKVYMK